MSTILLVDDEEEILEFLERILSKTYTILKAPDGEAALKILEEATIHLIISDVMMPGMDGFDLCKVVKSTVEYSRIPVILLTAKNTVQDKVEGLELGADVYIDKPFSKEHLMAQIASLLYNRDKVYEFFISSPLAQVKINWDVTNADRKFLEELDKCIIEHMKNPGLDIEKLARKMAMSRSALYRKVKMLSDLSPNELINLNRLKKVIELLADGHYRISEICQIVGFGTQSNFNRLFFQQFKMTPTEYIQSKKSR